MSELQSKTDEELNVMLAELVGWKFRSDGARLNGTDPDGRKLSSGQSLTLAQFAYLVTPRFCSSLDAVSQVEAGLTQEQLYVYDEKLRRAHFADDKDDHWKPRKAASYIWHATARQRTLALIATLGDSTI